MPTQRQVGRMRRAFVIALLIGLLLLATHAQQIDACSNAAELSAIIILRGIIIMFIAASGLWAFQRLDFHAGRVRRDDKRAA